MLNSTIILVAVLAIAFGGYRYGKHVCEGEHAVDVVDKQEQIIDTANEDVKASTKRAVASAKARVDAGVRATEIRREGEIDATSKANLACSRDADSMRLLHKSIDHANGTSTASGSVPDPLPPHP